MDNDTLLGIAISSVCGLGLLGAIAVLVLGTIFKWRIGINFAALVGKAKCAECGAPCPAVARIPKTPY